MGGGGGGGVLNCFHPSEAAANRNFQFLTALRNHANAEKPLKLLFTRLILPPPHPSQRSKVNQEWLHRLEELRQRQQNIWRMFSNTRNSEIKSFGRGFSEERCTHLQRVQRKSRICSREKLRLKRRKHSRHSRVPASVGRSLARPSAATHCPPAVASVRPPVRHPPIRGRPSSVVTPRQQDGLIAFVSPASSAGTSGTSALVSGMCRRDAFGRRLVKLTFLVSRYLWRSEPTGRRVAFAG